MKKRITKILLSICSLTLLVACGDKSTGKFVKVPNEPENLPIATIEVEGMGTMKLELYPHKAPNTVNNFISLANSGYYDGIIFHRIIKDFMAQGGDPLGNGTGGPGYEIAGEFSENGFEANDIKHEKGVISMARTEIPDSAGSQFFIMTSNVPSLDGKYAAFGRVIEGMDIVDKLNKVETIDPMNRNDKPVEDVKIKSIRVDTKGTDYNEPLKYSKQ